MSGRDLLRFHMWNTCFVSVSITLSLRARMPLSRSRGRQYGHTPTVQNN